jgi:hypothetical protein
VFEFPVSPKEAKKKKEKSSQNKILHYNPKITKKQYKKYKKYKKKQNIKIAYSTIQKQKRLNTIKKTFLIVLIQAKVQRPSFFHILLYSQTTTTQN